MNRKDVDGKVVLITGGSRGIGRETARMFGSRGARVYICGRSKEQLDSTTAELAHAEITVHPIQTDVRNSDECKDLIDEIHRRESRLDIVICNAGMSMRGTIEESSPDVIRSMVEINYLGSAYVARFALPLVKTSQGSIVFISTLAALHGLPRLGPYSASKCSLQGFSESLRLETASSGVHIGLVYVGFTENDEGKCVYRADGTLVPIDRKKNSQSQYQTANHILQCAIRRKHVVTLTALGHAASFIYRLFPRLSDFLILRFTNTNKDMYQVQG